MLPSWRAESKTESWIRTFLSQENWDGVNAFCLNNHSSAFEWSVTAELNPLTGKEELYRNLPLHLALSIPTVPIVSGFDFIRDVIFCVRILALNTDFTESYP